MSPQRSIKIDVASDISIPIKTSLSVLIARDAQGLDLVESKTIDFIIDYTVPESGYTGSNTITTGAQGLTGLPGAQGIRGYTGSAGTTASKGYTGSTGISGEIGYTGSQGQIGYTGSKGASGIAGYAGSQGNTGIMGTSGGSGFTGYTGSQGDQGFTGPVGYTGSKSHAFNVVRVPGQSDIIFDKAGDVLNILPGAGVGIDTGGSSLKIYSANMPVAIMLPCVKETANVTVGTGIRKIRAPYTMTLTEVRASLSAPQTSGNTLTIQLVKNGQNLLSTPLTINQGETTSKTADVPAVINLTQTSVLADEEISVNVLQAGTGAKGLQVMLIGSVG